MIKYKFRAEAAHDAHQFFKLDPLLVVNGKIEQVKLTYPDMVVTFESNGTIDQLKDLMEQVPKSHVMIETLAIKSEYTGERTYDD